MGFEADSTVEKLIVPEALFIVFKITKREIVPISILYFKRVFYSPSAALLDETNKSLSCI